MGYFKQKRTLMLTQTTYIEYLLSMPKSYTCAHLAAHLLELSHD